MTSKITMLTVFEEFVLHLGSQYELWAEESRENYISKVLEEMNNALKEIDDEKIPEIETR